MKRSKNKNFTHISKLIDGLIDSCRRDADTDMTKIFSIWEQVVGSTIAENASPAAFKGRLLIVHVTNSPWLHQLGFLKSDLIKKLNASLGHERVGEIKFKIGPL